MSFRLLLLVRLFLSVRSRWSSADPLFRKSCIALVLVAGELTKDTADADGVKDVFTDDVSIEPAAGAAIDVAVLLQLLGRSPTGSDHR